MRLLTLDDGTRDGELAIAHGDGARAASARAIAPHMQAALDRWDEVEPPLRALAAEIDAGRVVCRPIDFARVRAPLPRPYEWIDGSAYIHHIVLVRKARGAALPETLETDPLVYQGGTSEMLGCRAPIAIGDVSWGCDFEAEIGVVLGDVPRGVKASAAARFVKLVVILNDVTFRNLVPAELAKGFGFFASKPATAFAPFAVTPDELGDAFRGGRVHLRLKSTLNGILAGDPDAGPEMHFSFYDLIAHIAKTRSFTAGTILGSGTVSNVDRARGVSCLAEKRTLETLDTGKPVTPFLQPGDTVAIEMFDGSGRSIFGRIDQQVLAIR
ncbi:MAG TPA: fumarylacetoacetate hydrolase family protein [Polyangiaceae bacterium]|nr:fumarylacetoacetate hydrolase family protein [Polyangiaceae bacterium]